MDVPEGIDVDRLKIVHIKSDGTVGVVDFEIVDGKIVFEVDSFSIFAFAELEEIPVAIPETGDNSLPIGAFMILALAITSLLVVKRKSVNNTH